MKRRLCVVLVVGALISSCGGSNPSTPTTPSSQTAFQGSVAGSGGQTGTLTVTVQAVLAASSASFFHFPFVATLHAQTTVTATGSLHIAGGGTSSLTGTYDSSTKALSLSGGGFTFAGAFGGGVMSGTYTGPNSVTGGFSTLSTAGASVAVYCGTFTAGTAGSSGGVLSGVFNLQVSASGTASGVARVTTGGCSGCPTVIYLQGTVSGTTLTTTTSDGGTGTGTVQNGTMAGTGSNNTVFSGSTSACQ